MGAVSAVWLGMPIWIWLAFLAFVLLILAIDLGVFNKTPHVIDMRESVKLAAFCVGLGWAFSAVVWYLYYTGVNTGGLDPHIAAAATPRERAWTAFELYLTGLVVEQTLSLDNIFVMSLIFGYFAIPQKYQHRVLFWGILGVIVLRALMIGIGAALIQNFHWVLYIFAAFLVFTGFKMLLKADSNPDIASNPILLWIRKRFRVTPTIEGDHFIIRRPHPETGKAVLWVTPLFVALVMIEFADLIFAVDSIPAIFALTQDPFIVYTSNIFAVLGLRSLYFVLAAMVHRFEGLKYALALVLIFIGSKIFVQPLVGKIPTEVSLGVTFALLAGGIVYSLATTRETSAETETAHTQVEPVAVRVDSGRAE